MALADDVVEFVDEEVAAGVAPVEPVEELELADEEADGEELDDDDPPPPLPPLDRFPESRGAINPANCSAEMVPLSRIDWSTSPSATIVVRVAGPGVLESGEPGFTPSLA